MYGSSKLSRVVERGLLVPMDARNQRNRAETSSPSRSSSRSRTLREREREREKRKAESLPEEKEEEEEGRSGSGNDRPSALEANIDECPALLALRNRALRPTLESLSFSSSPFCFSFPPLFFSLFLPVFALSTNATYASSLPSIERRKRKTKISTNQIRRPIMIFKLLNLILKFSRFYISIYIYIYIS